MPWSTPPAPSAGWRTSHCGPEKTRWYSTAQYGGPPNALWLGEVRYDGRVHLWHPDSPGMRVWVRPSLLRRLRIVRSPFATLGEARWAV